MDNNKITSLRMERQYLSRKANEAEYIIEAIAAVNYGKYPARFMGKALILP